MDVSGALRMDSLLPGTARVCRDASTFVSLLGTDCVGRDRTQNRKPVDTDTGDSYISSAATDATGEGEFVSE